MAGDLGEEGVDGRQQDVLLMARELVDVLELAQEAAIDPGDLVGVGRRRVGTENVVRRGLQRLGEAEVFSGTVTNPAITSRVSPAHRPLN